MKILKVSTKDPDALIDDIIDKIDCKDICLWEYDEEDDILLSYRDTII